jgi:hypothetical protein
MYQLFPVRIFWFGFCCFLLEYIKVHKISIEGQTPVEVLILIFKLENGFFAYRQYGIIIEKYLNGIRKYRFDRWGQHIIKSSANGCRCLGHRRVVLDFWVWQKDGGIFCFFL